MVIAVQGEGLLAILSTDCLDSKSATVPSSGWRGPGSAPGLHPTKPWVRVAFPKALAFPPPRNLALTLTPQLISVPVFEIASLRSKG